MKETPIKKVIIVGAGFGGMYTLIGLHKLFHNSERIEVTVLDKRNYFLFTPLLHEVATGGLNPNNVVIPIRNVLNCCLSRFYKTKVKSVDLKNKTVHTDSKSFSYDYLVLGMGATTNFFNVEGAKENTFVLKDLNDAIKMRSRFIDLFEEASMLDDPIERKKLLSFAVVGGGATGVELAAEMAEYFYNTFSSTYKEIICKNEVSLYLVNSASSLLPQFHADLQKKALEHLETLGIKVLLDSNVTKVEKGSITLSSGKNIQTNTTIWTAGVKANKLDLFPNSQQGKDNKIIVEETLQLQDFPEVFVLGDQSRHISKNSSSPTPMLAQVASKEGIAVAFNIQHLMNGVSTKPFVYKSSGNLVSLGRWMALADINGIRFYGKFAWWVWRTIYLSKFISWPKRLKVAVDWTVDLFFSRDISKA